MEKGEIMKAVIFEVKIELSNEAMQKSHDVAELLHTLAEYVEEFGPEGSLRPDDLQFRLVDINGNRVGIAHTYAGTWRAENVGGGFGMRVQAGNKKREPTPMSR